MNYDMMCKKMNCKMSFEACMLRQEKSRKTGWKQTGLGIMTFECNGCEQGAEIMLKYKGYSFDKKPLSCICGCKGIIYANGLTKRCYQRRYQRNKRSEQTTRKDSGGEKRLLLGNM